MIIGRFQTIGCGICVFAVLAACSSQTSALRDSFALKQEAAKTIGKGLGLRTVWNTIYPCDVGRVYERVVHSDATFGLTPYSQDYLGVVSTTPPITRNDVLDQTWQESITGKGNVELQLGYMGLGLDTSVKNTRAVTFAASGDHHVYVVDQPAFLTYLNDQSRGTELRNSIKHDLPSRAGQPQNASLPKYWIVTDSLAVKDFTITLNASSAGSIQLSDAQAAAIAAFAGLPITGAINATVTSDGSVSISSPGAATLVGVCVPLIWNAQTNQVEVDLGKTLLYANGVANDVSGSNLQRAIRFKTIRFKTIR
jgi:hypothetical protein